MVLRPSVWLQHPTLLRGFIIKSTNYIQVRWYTSQCWTTLGPAMQNYVPILWVTTNMQNGRCLKKVFIGQPQYSSRLDMVGKQIHKVFKISNFEYAYRRSNSNSFPKRKSTVWIFPLCFQLPYLPEETCFQQWMFSTMGIFCSGRYQPGCTGIF